MRFLYNKNAGDERLNIQNEGFLHLKARRIKLGDRQDIRNLNDGYNYIYEVVELGRKNAILELVFKNSVVENPQNFEIAWACVEASVIEKSLPSLNEMGVKTLHLVFCEYSQQDLRYDLARFERILHASSEQCGRNSIMQIKIWKNLDEILSFNPNLALIDFGGQNLDNAPQNQLLLIGPEGGFSDNERAKVKEKFGLGFENILRSNTAIIAVTAKMLG